MNNSEEIRIAESTKLLGNNCDIFLFLKHKKKERSTIEYF